MIYLKRSGGQDQYSEPLRFQTRALDPFAELVAWICAHLSEDLSADVLAARVRLSARQFNRRFAEATGTTPAHFVESARLSEARQRLAETRRSIDSVSLSVGYQSADVFRRRFERRFGVSPKSYRERFAAAPPVLG